VERADGAGKAALAAAALLAAPASAQVVSVARLRAARAAPAVAQKAAQVQTVGRAARVVAPMPEDILSLLTLPATMAAGIPPARRQRNVGTGPQGVQLQFGTNRRQYAATTLRFAWRRHFVASSSSIGAASRRSFDFWSDGHGLQQREQFLLQPLPRTTSPRA